MITFEIYKTNHLLSKPELNYGTQVMKPNLKNKIIVKTSLNYEWFIQIKLNTDKHCIKQDLNNETQFIKLDLNNRTQFMKLQLNKSD